MRQVRVSRAIVAAAVGLSALGAGSASAAVEFDRLVEPPTTGSAEHTAWVDPGGQRVWGQPKGLAFLSIAASRVPRTASTRLELADGTAAGGPILSSRTGFSLRVPNKAYSGVFYVSYQRGVGTRVREKVGRLVAREPKRQPGTVHPREPVDTVVVVDGSSTIGKIDPLQRRRDALDMLFAMSKKGDRVAVVAFGSGSRRILPLTRVRSAAQTRKMAKRVRTRLTTGGRANYDAAFNLAAETILRGRGLERRKQVVFLTGNGHGYPGASYQNTHQRLALNATGRAWPVCALRIGSAVTPQDDKRLNRIADVTHGFADQVDSVDQLPEAFAECMAPPACSYRLAGADWDLSAGQTRLGKVNIPLSRRRAVFRIIGKRRHQLRLVGPSGRTYGPKSLTSGMRFRSGRNWALYEIDGPRAGGWGVSVKASRLKAGTTDSVAVRASVDRCGARTTLLFPGGQAVR